MSKLIPETSNLIGNWLVKDKMITGDANCERIESLVKNYLIKLGNSDAGWSSLYLDPEDKRFWERTYLQSEMHGGGPPSLILLNEEEARKKYGI